MLNPGLNRPKDWVSEMLAATSAHVTLFHPAPRDLVNHTPPLDSFEVICRLWVAAEVAQDFPHGQRFTLRSVSIANC
jgi:hypothetical protein